MRKYNEYKDSGVKWLSEIPSDWQIYRTSDICIQNKKINKNLEINNLLSLSYGNIIRKDIDTLKGLLPDSFDNYQILEYGDIVLRLTDLQNDKKSLRVGFVKELGIITSAYIGLKLKTKLVDNKYVFYLLYAYDIKKVFYSQGGSMRQSMKFDDFKNIPFICPLLSEQQTIANYLDAKTQAIDKKVTLLEQKIETYKKLKNTIIAKAVTQGISNEKLSVNDLGFKTPSHWEKYRLKDLGKLYSGLSGKSGDDFNQDDNPNNRGFIPFTNIANNTYLKKDHLGTVAINPGERQNKVRKGDLFFLMSSEGYGDIGKTAVLSDEIEEAYLNSFCKGYRLNQSKCNPYFLNYLLLSNIYRQRLLVEGKGFTRINLKMEKVTDFEIFIPSSVSEQEEIATYLDQKTATIDAIVSNIRKQIETLKQLRKTLINDVVTGKIKVVA